MGLGTSWGTGEAAPQCTNWHLQIKANKPVQHIEEEESDRENNSRVVIQAVDVDAQATSLPGTALTIRHHAKILLETLAALIAGQLGVQATGTLGATWAGGSPDRARWAFLSITSLRGDDLTHKHLLLLTGTGTGTGTGISTATNWRLKSKREEEWKSKECESRQRVAPGFSGNCP
jgi:hypothetical protein